MIQFSSKPPFQKKFWDSDRSYYFVDRPQNNPTNRILDETRSEAVDMDAEIRWVWHSACYPDITLAEREHAYKVLRKWEAVFGEES